MNRELRYTSLHFGTLRYVRLDSSLFALLLYWPECCCRNLYAQAIPKPELAEPSYPAAISSAIQHSPASSYLA